MAYLIINDASNDGSMLTVNAACPAEGQKRPRDKSEQICSLFFFFNKIEETAILVFLTKIFGVNVAA